jgi:hypothetical protein
MQTKRGIKTWANAFGAGIPISRRFAGRSFSAFRSGAVFADAAGQNYIGLKGQISVPNAGVI